MREKPFLIIIEADSGLYSWDLYKTLEEARTDIAKATKEGQIPFCIYNLDKRDLVWTSSQMPPYGPNVCSEIILKRLSSPEP